MLDFEAITEFWFGDLPEPEFPFKPISIGPLELIDPSEELPEPEERFTPESEE